VEQDKSLGKGGICWDAAFILGDYTKAMFLNNQLSTPKKIVELGCGTGLCGMMVAKAVAGLEVYLTDLPELMPLLQRNITNNFSGTASLPTGQRNLKGKSPVIGQVLDWAEVAGSREWHSKYDVILGADVVASLYDPVALAKTIHALAHRESLILLTFKERLSTMHRQFESEMTNLFEDWTIQEPSHSRNRNPDVKIIVARRPKPKK
jgi:predicted nicotinamide N-methyase